MKTNKSEDLKVRTDPITKRTLEQMAAGEHLTVSDVARRALREYIERKLRNQTNHAQT